MPALYRASLRYLARHPWQSWLSVIGIALGVAVVVAVDLANQSARTAMQLSVERISGRATHRILSATGDIQEEVYVRLRIEQGLRPAAPVVEGVVRIADRTVTLLGIDPFAAKPLEQGGTSLDMAALPGLLTRPGALLIGVADARSLGVEKGSLLRLHAGGREQEAFVAGILATDNPVLMEGLVLADIATAQELMGRTGYIDRIDLILDQGRARELARSLPPGLRLETAGRHTEGLAQMTRAFHTNLSAMSLLAVLVGGFIIYNTMTFAVLRRRSLLGTLRTLGVTRGQLFGLVLGESLVFAMIGALIGMGAGILVGWGLVQLVTRTINDLYFTLTVSQLFVSPWSLVKGAGLGVLVTLVAALGPALEAAASEPRDLLLRHGIEQQRGRLSPWLSLAGISLMLCGFVLVQLSERSIGIGFSALFLVVVGFSLCVPLALRGFSVLLSPILGRFAGPQGRLAARGITASISRTGIAVAALTVAVSATVGVGIMIDSFRGSLATWLEDTLASDLYVSAPSASSSEGRGGLPNGLGEAILALPGVVEISKGRSVQIQAGTGPVMLLALESSSRSHRGLRFKGAVASGLWERFEAGELALISEPYGYHHQLGIGERVSVFTALGWREFEIGGVFMDYGSDSGMLVLPRRLYATLWDDPGVSTIGVVLAEGVDPASAREELAGLVAGYGQAIQVRDNRSIRERSMEVFDRTFVITRVLRMLAVGVAFVGVLSALMALQLERARDYAILRAIGFTPAQLLVLILLQTLAMGLAAGALSMPLGWIMGDMLIQVINVRSFGWTMDMLAPGYALINGMLVALAAALLAGLYPALRSTGADPAVALRGE